MIITTENHDVSSLVLVRKMSYDIGYIIMNNFVNRLDPLWKGKETNQVFKIIFFERKKIILSKIIYLLSTKLENLKSLSAFDGFSTAKTC